MKEMKMREAVIEKVTLNIGVGEAGIKLQNAKTLLDRLSGKHAVETAARVRNPVFKIRKGDPIGVKVTLRGADALDFLKKALETVDNKVSERAFDRNGNFSFGVKEYIDFPGAKYDPKIGIIGFDVCVTLGRRGNRVKRRRKATAKIGKAHRLTAKDGIEFAKNILKIEIV